MKRTIAKVTAALLLSLCATASASDELVRNGLFSSGSEGIPEHWHSEAYTKGTATTEFRWHHSPTGVSIIEIDNREANDARWLQSVPVSPNTWYRVSGWVRSEDVGSSKMGAYLSVMDTFFNSRDLRGTQDWQLLSFWVKTGALETKLKIAARLGGYSSDNVGRAFFTAISVEEMAYPSVGTPFVHGGVAGESASSKEPWTTLIVLVLVVGLAMLIWRYVAPPDSRIPR